MTQTYTATLQGSTLSVYTHQSGASCLITLLQPGSHSRFYIKDNGIYHDSFGVNSAMIYQAPSTKEAELFLQAINNAIYHRCKVRNIACLTLLVTALVLCITYGWYVFTTLGEHMTRNNPTPVTQLSTSNPTAIQSAPVVAPQPISPIQVPVIPKTMPAQTNTSTTAATGYQKTAQVLRNAAESGFYTIALSSGHQRTLYVFSDPLCHNCQIIEPALEALAQKYNVELFPVTLVGKQQTIDLVSPILCQTPLSRKTLWKKLFQIDSGMGPNESTLPLASCETGTEAINRNDTAFDAYNLPGTPSLIADDGRYIPLTSLKSDDALEAFLNTPFPQ